MSFTHALATNRYGEADLIVSTNLSNGTHSTLASAMAAAVAGQTIFLRDSVTENVTITPGVNIASWQGSPSNTPSITGTLTMTGAGASTITGIRLQTNSAFAVAVTGSAASQLTLHTCYINCTNNTGISYTSSSASSGIAIIQCGGNIATTGISLFASTGAGNTLIIDTNIENTGNSVTASTISAAVLFIRSSRLVFPVTTSGTADIQCQDVDISTSVAAAICLTHGGTGGNSYLHRTSLASNNLASVSISAGASLVMGLCTVNSTIANPITGAGSLFNGGIAFSGNISGAGFGINTTTVTGRNFAVGGITFDGGTNVLNNYTVGTWTPSIVPSGVAYTSITYGTRVGYYTRIGNLVTATCFVAVSAITVGAATGDATVTGLPVVSSNVANILNMGALRLSNVALASTLWVQAIISGNQSLFNMQKYNTAATPTNVAANTITSTTDIAATITYRV